MPGITQSVYMEITEEKEEEKMGERQKLLRLLQEFIEWRVLDRWTNLRTILGVFWRTDHWNFFLAEFESYWDVQFFIGDRTQSRQIETASLRTLSQILSLHVQDLETDREFYREVGMLLATIGALFTTVNGIPSLKLDPVVWVGPILIGLGVGLAIILRIKFILAKRAFCEFQFWLEEYLKSTLSETHP